MEEQDDKSNKPTKKRSPLWYELPLILQIVGGIIAFLVIRKDDPKKARNCLVLGILLTIIPLIIFGLFAIPLSTENPFYVVASGSMMPALNVYDVAIVDEGISFEELRIGDIIVFYRPSGEDRVIMHRIVDIVSEDPRTLRTKGDNNVASIPGTDFPITQREYIGKVDSVIPQIGYVTQFLKPPVNYLLLLVYLIPVILHIRFKRQSKKDS